MCRYPWVVCAIFVAASALGSPKAAAQQEDGELRLMAEPTSYTDVIDAFDDEDPFDLNIHVGYRFERSFGTIQREHPQPSLTDSRTFRPVAVADWEHTQNILDLQLDVGLYEDVAFYFKMPVILSDNRSLDVYDGDDTTPADVQSVLRTFRNDPTSEILLPGFGGANPQGFDSPTRSGLDQVALGLAWAITNQYRQPHLPTWLLMLEGQFNVGDDLRACNDDVDYSPDSRCNGGDDPGMSRGMFGFKAETRASRRFRVAEPYAGLMFEIEWPVANDELFKPAGDIAGFMNTIPPIEGEITFGVAFIPWERKDRFQRLTIDLRGQARYISEGRDYSPLFDALGTSTSPYLRQDNLEGIPPEGGESVHYFGLSDVQAHGRYGGRLLVNIRAARYVEFMLGGGLFYTTPHLITFTDACNPNESSDDPIGTGQTGRCNTGIINPHHRPAIDLPGNRFQLNGSWTVDFQARAIARF